MHFSYNFLSVSLGAHKPIFLSKFMPCDHNQHDPIVGLRPSDFYWTEMADKQLDKRSDFFYQIKSWCKLSDFHSDFLSAIKN